MTPAERRLARARRALNQPHSINSLLDASRELRAAERALEEERAKPKPSEATTEEILGAVMATIRAQILGP
jgi:hypothetical protein